MTNRKKKRFCLIFPKAKTIRGKEEMSESFGIKQDNKPLTESRCSCPKSSKNKRPWRNYPWLIWIFPIVGLLSLIWFLVRVIPKPSRATYPCQRVAAPLAGSFIVWITGLIGSILAYRKAKRFVHQSRYVITGFCIAASVMAVWWSLNITGESPLRAALIPTDPSNSPMGVAQGIYPGRVVWVRDNGATNWDGSKGNWWDEGNTDQSVVDYMMSKAIQSLTAEPNNKSAWDALFRHFNKTKGFGDVGYQLGEKIAIKINMNQDSGGTWRPAGGYPSPQVIYSVLNQLINVVGVPGHLITIYDASRYIGNPIYNKVSSNADPNFQNISFVVRPNLARSGRIAATYDAANPLYTKAPIAYFPQCVTQAKYLINMALLRPHSLYGITVCAKNHFGSTYFPTSGGWTPSPLHSYGLRTNPMGSYNCLVSLNGHKHLAGKTLLYMIDGLYPSKFQEAVGGDVIKYQSFGDDWFSSMLISQDPVAIDSVAFDFMRNEPRCTNVTGRPDNYLHEMALANNPPSETFYDPEGDGIRLESLGVHEHWNNPTDKQYSRNLGIGDGIELVAPSIINPDGPVENITKGTRYDYIHHAINDADPGDEIIVGPGIYQEIADFNGKNLTIRSTEPNNPDVVAATIIDGGIQSVSFTKGEDASSILAGFTITGAERGIYCSGTTPTIVNCKIVSNNGAGIKLWNQSNPTIINCIIAGNRGAGIEMWAPQTGRFVQFNHARIINCTISGNAQQGIWGDEPTVSNTIIYFNGYGGDYDQIDCYNPTVSFSDIQDGWQGQGIITDDPCFVKAGYWANPTEPTIPIKPSEPGAVWMDGDYHLRWDSPCINTGDPNFSALDITSDIDGEPRVMTERVDIGCDEVGQKQADFSRNGLIDIEDLSIFVQVWLSAASDNSWRVLCDLYEDNFIDLSDWAEFADDWLWQAEWYTD